MKTTTWVETLSRKLPAVGLIGALSFMGACSSTPVFKYDSSATVVSHQFYPAYDKTVTDCEVYSQNGFCRALNDHVEHVPDAFGLLLEECDTDAKACVQGSIVVDKVLYDQVPDGATVTIDESGAVTA